MRFLNWDATLAKAKEIGRAEGRAAGRAEGRAEALAEIRAERDREWTAYTARLKAALERGEPFNEPPPSAYPRPQD